MYLNVYLKTDFQKQASGSLKININVYLVFLLLQCGWGGLIVLSAHYVPHLRINVSMQIFINAFDTNIQMTTQSVIISC